MQAKAGRSRDKTGKQGFTSDRALVLSSIPAKMSNGLQDMHEFDENAASVGIIGMGEMGRMYAKYLCDSGRRRCLLIRSQMMQRSFTHGVIHFLSLL